MSQANAVCQNEDCEHDWGLTKNPQQYARGWPTCPECGSTKVEVAGQTKDDLRQQQVQEAKPARQQQPEAGAIQPAEDDIVAGGEQIAGIFAGATDENVPVERRAEAVTQGAQLLGGVFSGLMKFNEQKRRQEQEYAQEANIEKTSDKPECECGYVFSRLSPQQKRVQCPKCGIEYEVQ